MIQTTKQNMSLHLKYIFVKTDRVVKKYLTTAAYEELMQIEQQIKKCTENEACDKKDHDKWISRKR